MAAMKKRPLEPYELQESEKLKKIVNDKKKELNLTQEMLAERMKISQGGLNHYLNGINPLNPTIASQFAKELNITVNQFSQRLANEISQMAKMTDEYQSNTIVNNNIVSGNGNNLGSFTNCEHNKKIVKKMAHLMPDNSLLPVIPQGSELQIDETEHEITDGKVYLIEYSGIRWYRRLFKLPNNQVAIKVFNNVDFAEYTVSLNDVKILGRVKQWLVND